MIAFLLSNWKTIGVLAIAVAVAGYIGVLRLERTVARNERDKAVNELTAFVNQTKVDGERAVLLADKQKAADTLKKEKSDAENKRSHANDVAVIAKLRADRDRAGSSGLPAAPAGSSRPLLACFDRPEYSRAYGEFVAEIRGLATEGTTSTIDLDSVKVWHQE